MKCEDCSVWRLGLEYVACCTRSPLTLPPSHQCHRTPAELIQQIEILRGAIRALKQAKEEAEAREA